MLDAFSRRVVGWAMANHLRTELVLEALNMAIWQRRPDHVVHHSDQGTQYTSIEFGKRCRKLGVVPSTGSAGDCFDNAVAESFFATLETELLWRETFRSQAEARMAIFEFIEGFYNPKRRHSSNGHVAPIVYERRFADRDPEVETAASVQIAPRSDRRLEAAARLPQVPTSLLLRDTKYQAINRPPKRGNSKAGQLHTVARGFPKGNAHKGLAE